MSKILSVVCVGTGYFSQFHYEAWSRHPQAQIVGVNNRNITKAHDFASLYSIPEVDNDLGALLKRCRPDIVDIITPPETHLQAVKIAAKLGIDVICQKPFGENVNQAQEMTAIAKEAGIKLIIHENFRFMPWYRQIKHIVNKGKLGQILNASFKLRPGDGQGEQAYMLRQPYFQSMPRFLVHETAIHLVDTFRFLFGEPLSVFADLRRCNAQIKGEDAGIIIFEFPESLRVIFDGNRLLDHQATNTRRTMGEMSIEGTQGELRLNGEGELLLRSFAQQDFSKIDYQWQDKHFGGDCVFNTIEHIVSHYLHKTPLENQAHDYLRNIVIEQAIYDSNDKGHKLRL